MNTITTVWVTARFTALHRWRNAPDEVKFLRDYHRHEFHVRLGLMVSHLDRDVEFIALKTALQNWLNVHMHGRQFDYSCEQIAQRIMVVFSAEWCEVSEDGENGAMVMRDRSEELIDEVTDAVLPST